MVLDTRPEHADHFVIGGVHRLLARLQETEERSETATHPPGQPRSRYQIDPKAEPGVASEQITDAAEPSKIDGGGSSGLIMAPIQLNRDSLPHGPLRRTARMR